MKTGYFRSTYLFSILLRHLRDEFLHSWKIKGFREILGKCDTCETDLLMIKVLKTDKGIKGAEKQENITIYNRVTSSQI